MSFSVSSSPVSRARRSIAALARIFSGLIELTGDKSSFKSDIGYLGQREQTVDINLVVNHYGKSTESEINASGALKDSSSKIFRGTIDFKTGSSDSE